MAKRRGVPKPTNKMRSRRRPARASKTASKTSSTLITLTKPTAPPKTSKTNKKKSSGKKRSKMSSAGQFSMAQSEARMAKLLAQAIETFGEDDPLVQDCIATLVGISCGRITGRYVGERLRATNAILDRLLGRPEQPIIHRGEKEEPLRIVYEIENADGSPTSPWIAPVPEDRGGSKDS